MLVLELPIMNLLTISAWSQCINHSETWCYAPNRCTSCWNRDQGSSSM